LVAADCTRLVEVARLRSHSARAHPFDQIFAGVVQGRRCRRSELASVDRALSFGAPHTRGGEGRKRLADALFVTRAPRARLVGRVAVALATLPRRAGLRMPDFDPRELSHEPSE